MRGLESMDISRNANLSLSLQTFASANKSKYSMNSVQFLPVNFVITIWGWCIAIGLQVAATLTGGARVPSFCSTGVVASGVIT